MYTNWKMNGKNGDVLFLYFYIVFLSILACSRVKKFPDTVRGVVGALNLPHYEGTTLLSTVLCSSIFDRGGSLRGCKRKTGE